MRQPLAIIWEPRSSEAVPVDAQKDAPRANNDVKTLCRSRSRWIAYQRNEFIVISCDRDITTKLSSTSRLIRFLWPGTNPEEEKEIAKQLDSQSAEVKSLKG